MVVKLQACLGKKSIKIKERNKDGKKVGKKKRRKKGKRKEGGREEDDWLKEGGE